MNRLSRLVNDRVILVVGWLAFLTYAFPGYMSYDSAWQLSQARGLEPINDWHPPLMTFMWRFADAIVAGPFLMLVIQSLTFLVGLYAVFCRVMSKRAAAITASIVLLLPQNIIVLAVIWKDSQMAGFLVAAIACLLGERRGWRITGLVLLFFATGVRYNAVAATFPIIVLLWNRDVAVHWLRRSAIAVAIWIAVTVCAFVANGVLTESKQHVWPIGAAAQEIYAMIRFSDVDTAKLVADHPQVPWSCSEDIKVHVTRWYKPTNTYVNVFEGDAGIMRYPKDATEREAIGALWRDMIVAYPAAWLRHRYEVSKMELGVAIPVWHLFAPEDGSAQKLHLERAPTSIQTAWANAMTRILRLRTFRPRFYFVLAIVLLFFMRRQRIALAIVASGLAYELGLFVLAPAVDYRYNHWLVAATIIGAIILVARRLRPDRGIEGTA